MPFKPLQAMEHATERFTLARWCIDEVGWDMEHLR
jgi:hypothetical protein